MASRKNRSGKANRRSPKSASGAVALRWRALMGWIDAHRWPVAIAGFLALFAAAGVGGYWLAERLEPKPAKVTYARIEDIPGLPRYIETEPDQKVPTVEDKPRPRPTQVAAAAGSEQQTWRRNAVPFRDLASKPLIAIVIDDVGLDRPHSKRA